MSSTSRSPGDKKPEGTGDEPPSKRPASPGRYSMSTEGSTEMAAVRIDSTRMAAVRPESARDTPNVLPGPVPPPADSPKPARRGTLPQGMEAVSPPHPP